MPKACGMCGAAITGRGATAYCSHACYVEKSRQNAAETLVARFWAKVQKTPQGCWLWTGN